MSHWYHFSVTVSVETFISLFLYNYFCTCTTYTSTMVAITVTNTARLVKFISLIYGELHACVATVYYVYLV